MTSITIHFTADLHGRVSPIDPLRGEPFAGGLARTATLLGQARREHPDTIFLDLGDLAQGTPMSYLAAKRAPGKTHPLVRSLEALGCEGLVVGNHEFNWGMRWIEAVRREASFPLLGANVIGPDGSPFFEPVLRRERYGKRIAILALTTPQVPRWEEPWNYAGLRFVDAVEVARDWVPRLREDSDAVVVAAHMGWDGVSDGSLEDPLPHENDVGRLLAEVPGIDATLMAHTHRIDERRGELGTLAVQAGAGGEALGGVQLTWKDAVAGPTASSLVRRVSLDTQPDETILELVSSDETRARRWMNRTIGTATAPFGVDGLRYRDNAVLNLIHRVQLESSGADLSSASLFRDEGLAAGPLRVRDFFRVYPFENDLTIVELTVDDVRAYLEQIAEIYLGPAANGAPPPWHPDVRLYNHDALAGVEYRIDPSRPTGRRVERLTFRGEELPASAKRTLALPSYRAQGGGGYRALRRARVVERTGREVRGLLVDFVRRNGEIAPELFGNWSVVGAGDAS